MSIFQSRLLSKRSKDQRLSYARTKEIGDLGVVFVDSERGEILTEAGSKRVLAEVACVYKNKCFTRVE